MGCSDVIVLALSRHPLTVTTDTRSGAGPLSLAHGLVSEREREREREGLPGKSVVSVC